MYEFLEFSYHCLCFARLEDKKSVRKHGTVWICFVRLNGELVICCRFTFYSFCICLARWDIFFGLLDRVAYLVLPVSLHTLRITFENLKFAV